MADYGVLLPPGSPALSDPDLLGDALRAAWCEEYAAATPWVPSIDEIVLGDLTYLFDSGPAASGAEMGEDRVVGVWGRSRPPLERRDAARQRGFVPVPRKWSLAGLDRGHFVAHSLGGGMDMNFFPQRADLNRGRSAAGRRWRALERQAASPGALLFVRPIYTSSTWVPDWLDFGVALGGSLTVERFDNRP